MRAVRYHQKGAPEVLQVEELPTPEPGEGQAQVRILATGISYADILRRSGGYYPVPVELPHLPGTQMAGEVTAVGAGVDASLLGRTVFGPVAGSYAEYGVAAADALRVLPEGVAPATAVAVLTDADTANLCIRLAGRLQPGESVFVPAATGGVGYLAMQLARIYGAGNVFGGASSEAKRAAVADFGITPIDYTAEGWPADVIARNGGVGVDMALEVGGGQSVYDTLEVLKPGGRMVNYGNVSDTDAPVNPRQLLRRNLTLIGAFQSAATRDGLWVEERRAFRQEVMDLMLSGQLRPLIHRTFTLDEAAEAHHALEDRGTIGKVVLLPNG